MKIYLDPQPPASDSGALPAQQSGALTKDTAPVQFKEADMPADLKGTTIDFDDTVSSAKTQAKTAETLSPEELEFNKPAVTDDKPKPVEPTKPPEKGKLPDVNITPKKPEVPAQTPEVTKPVPAKGARDFSIFDPADVAIAKATNNQQFELLKKLALASKDTGDKLKVATDKLDAIAKDPNAIPQDWHNHPEAYALHPQYKAGYARLNTLSFEAEHYKQQVIKIKSNENWTKIVGYSQQTGEPIYSDPIPPDANAETNCLNWMNEGNRLAQQAQSGLQQFANTFQQRYGQAAKYVDEIMEQKWPWYKDPKDERQKYVQEFMKAVPDEFANHPSTKVSAHMWATIREFSAELDNLRAKDATGKRIDEIQAKVEPTATNTQVPADSNNKPKMRFGQKGQYIPPEVFTID